MKTTKIQIEIRWRTESDAEEALREAVSKIEEGYHSGFDSNDDGFYSFEISGDTFA